MMSSLAFLVCSFYNKYKLEIMPCKFSAIVHRRCQNVVRKSVIYSSVTRMPLFLFLLHFAIICDLLLNKIIKCMATWNISVKCKYSRTPVTRTRITRTPPLTLTESQFPWIWPNFSVIFTRLTQTRITRKPR